MASLEKLGTDTEDFGRRLYRWVMITIWVIPIWHVAVTLIIGVRAYLNFGTWPRAYHELSALGWTGHVLSFMWCLTLLAFFPTLISGVIGTPVYFWRRGAGWAVGGTFAYLLIWFLTYLFILYDPMRVVDWIMD